MVTIPTEKRKYYDEVSKTNTLGAYAGALLPAAQQYQEVVKQQQEIKIDSSMTDARLQLDKITNDWREANKDNPNNPEAMKELQANYNQVFSVLRNDIDPLYRQNFDLEANKLKGGYDINNQAWALKQNQENVKYNIRNSINNYLELAGNYGAAGNLEMAKADFEQSYNKLLDYAAKNLGTEQAAYLLNNYEEKYYKSFLDNLAEEDPKQVLEILGEEPAEDVSEKSKEPTKNVSEKENQAGSTAPKLPKKEKKKAENPVTKAIKESLGEKTVTKYKNYAKARQKKIDKQIYQDNYLSFVENPSLDGINQLKMLNPKMSKREEENLKSIYENSPNYEATTVFEGANSAKYAAKAFTDVVEGTEEENAIVLDNLADYVRKLQRSNIEKKLSEEDVKKFSNLAYKAVNDKMFSKQINKLFGEPSTFEKMASWVLPQRNKQKIEQIGGITISQTVDRLLKDDIEGARQVYKEGQKQAIQVRYPDIDFTNLKEGDIIWYAPTKQAMKFLGYSLDDVLVEVDPQTGAVK